ncbi:hypothetical protein ACFTZ8_15100 [Streptomyces fungicidicus]|uniref:hypothetical protein n=1 Tax=Streptomyces fungicidicus TaxID=68203 RepID=UPI00363F163A
MSDSVGPAGAEQAGPCCAAIAELRRRAEQRTAQRTGADGGEGLGASSPDSARDA